MILPLQGVEDIQRSSDLALEMDLLESVGQLLDFHMKHVYDISGSKGDSEFMKALDLLMIMMDIVKHRQSFNLAKFHLRRI